MKLTHTTGVKIDGKKYTVYQLFEEGVLVGECCMSRKHKFIKYNETTIEIRNHAPWYENEDIWFVESGTASEVGNYISPGYRYYDGPYAFLLNDEEWRVREMTHKEIDARSASHYWGGHVISSGDHKWIHCTFNYPPPQKSLWGPYVERVGTLEANGNYLAPILISFYVMEKIEESKNTSL